MLSRRLRWPRLDGVQRAATQIAWGILAGGFLVGALLFLGSGRITLRGVGTVGVYSLVMLAVCMLACIVPTCRAPRVQPTVALKDEA